MIAQRFLLLLGILLLNSLVNAETPPLAINRMNVSDEITLSGYPDIQMASEMYAADALVIDLRLPEEQIDKTPSLAEIGLEVHNLPIGKPPLKGEALDQLNAILERHRGRAIWLHCSSGNRAGLLWAAKMISEGMPVEQAIQQVTLVATRQATRDAINTYGKSIEGASGDALDEPR